MPSNRKIISPELKTALLKKKKKRLCPSNTRVISDKLIERDACLKAIGDLGNEFLNHWIFICGGRLVVFGFSQVAKSCYFCDIFGYRFIRYNQGKTRDNSSNNKKILAMINCILLNYCFVSCHLYVVDVMFWRNGILNIVDQKFVI